MLGMFMLINFCNNPEKLVINCYSHTLNVGNKTQRGDGTYQESN